VEYFPDTCPNCGFDGLKNSGTGTQKIEQFIKELCREYENDGYKYFYEVEDEEIKEMWDVNEYLGFYEDGSPCYS
jgi:hypothetical protein